MKQNELNKLLEKYEELRVPQDSLKDFEIEDLGNLPVLMIDMVDDEE